MTRIKCLLTLALFAFIMMPATMIAQTVEANKGKTKAKTIELNKKDFLKKVSNYEENPSTWKYLGDKPAIVDFYASWCGPCKTIAPILEELAAEYGDKIYIYKINTEKEQDIAAAFGISSIPNLLFIPMNETPQMARGGMSKAAFKDAIDRVLLKTKK